ncbi:TMEM175 family protein [Amycolatopsis sp. NBC_01480]|uniref:TMEM175 family protein n=1 Tax=Amycolatopsis sp. NBC_01480 TaxID=2903562 RepID=UPI002E2B77D1|nr:TMEM175 family protein [Amycolatopsis sp. NBC_01480]
MEKTRSPERLVFFTDAVAAIALTLLVLPLSELVPELSAEHAEAIQVFTDNQWKIYTFLLSFAVIARLWYAHHQIFEHVQAYNTALVYLNFGWIFTVALLPFPTQIVGGFQTSRFAVLFYIGTILVNSLCYTAMVLVIRRSPEVRGDAPPVDDQGLINSVLTSSAFLVSFIVGAIWPHLGYWALLLVAAAQWIARWIKPRSAVANGS